jgi:dolichol-phosphate mannosyltransferase
MAMERHSHDRVERCCLSLVIPAHNEAAGIRQAIDEADRALKELAAEYEIIVVDDGSSDATALEVANASTDFPRLRLLRHEHNQGYGAALRTGFTAARYDWVAFTDADCQFHLTELASLIPMTESCPIVVGYRMDRKDCARRRFFSWGYNLLARTLLGTGVRDCDCALKVFHRDVAIDLLPDTAGFFVNTEILTRARQRGYAIAEVGVSHRPRLSGTSKVSIGDIPRTLRALLPFWWTRVMFPDSAQRPEQENTSEPESTRFVRNPAIQVAILLLLTSLLFFSRLGSPLQEPEESRYAEIPRQMLDAGSFVVPRLHGEPYYDKPPLLYWLVMLSFRAFGAEDWSARLVSACAAFMTVIVTYVWGRRTSGPLPAFLGATILCLSARYVYLGRLLTMNSLLCLCVVGALAAAHIALIEKRLAWHWWLVSAMACGMGILTKGPVALALTLVPLAVLSRLDGRAAKPGLSGWCLYLGIAIGLAAPWYTTVAMRAPDFVDYFFWKQNLVRYVAPFDHAKPVWFYFGEVLIGMLPWSLLLPAFVWYLFKRPGPDGPRRPAALGMYLLAALWSFGFYSLAGSKRAGYILPALPPLALALGCYLDSIVQVLVRSSPETVALRRRARVFAVRLPSLILVASAGIALFCAAIGLVRTVPTLALSVSAVLLSWLVYRMIRHRPWSTAWIACGAAAFVVLFAGSYLTLPGYARQYSLRGQVRTHRQLAQNTDISIVSYPRRWDSVSFYLGRNDVRVFTAEQRNQLIAYLRHNPRTLAFIKSDRAFDDLLEGLPSSLQFVPEGRQGSVAVGWFRPRLQAPDAYLAMTK